MLNIKSNVWTIMILIFFIIIYLQILFISKTLTQILHCKNSNFAKMEDYEYF